MSQTSPRASVIMAVHNGEAHLSQAVESILAQSQRDFEFLIVDDASTDATLDMLSGFAARDGRVRIITNRENLGPYPSANVALREARGQYIVRLDADDVARPDRLEKQLAFMEANPDHMLVGSSFRSIDWNGDLLRIKIYPQDDFQLRWNARFGMSVPHPSFCFRAMAPDGSRVDYDPEFPVAQDCAMVVKLLNMGKGAILAEPLIDYRMHAANISTTRRQQQREILHEIAQRTLEAACGVDVAREFAGFLAGRYRFVRMDAAALRQAAAAFEALIARDAARQPDYRIWMRRRAAGMLAEAWFDQGAKPARALGFAAAAPGFLLPFFARVAETKGWIGAGPG